MFVSHAERFALTGDTLLIRACGRTDFQQGKKLAFIWNFQFQRQCLGFIVIPKKKNFKTLSEEKCFHPSIYNFSIILTLFDTLIGL